ncbi:protein PATRONUS 2-like [Primulina huaijiensis]|uniref:protein PATRONUS 2-like n=1 Tax=Primulina huaijiensis TaxID=1492673 RepID=UPI003CC76B24
MERPLTLKPLNIQDENANIRWKKAPVDGKSKSSKPVSKKGGAAIESRKALKDITNKTFLNLEASSQKKGLQNKCDVVEDACIHHVLETKAQSEKSAINEKLNIAEEGFLHDHRNCIKAQMAASELNFFDTVLPGHDKAESRTKKAKSDLDISSLGCYPEPEEIPMPEFADWFKSWWKSPPSSPTCWDSPPVFPFSWDHDSVELTLKEEDETCT